MDALEDFDKLTVEPGKPLPYLDPGQKHLLRVVHDESTFYANADQSQFWSDGEQQLLRQKSLGQSIMVSDFIVEGYGYLKDENNSARLCLETQKDGYFNPLGPVVQICTGHSATVVQICTSLVSTHIYTAYTTSNSRTGTLSTPRHLAVRSTPYTTGSQYNYSRKRGGHSCGRSTNEINNSKQTRERTVN